MLRSLFLSIVLAMLAVAFACNGRSSISGDTPTESYKRLYAAVKAKDIEAIKKNISKKTIDLGKVSMDRFNKTEAQAYENAFTATTFSETLPTIRDERIKENWGAIEVWNSSESKWDDLPYVLEDGQWKLAMGEAFAGTYKQPSKGRDFREKDAANAMSNVPIVPGSNGKSNSGPTANANIK